MLAVSRIVRRRGAEWKVVKATKERQAFVYQLFASRSYEDLNF
jgi:hypothetical protein